MEKEKASPRIENLSWGRLEIEGRGKPLKNAKLFPGGSSKWKWKEQGVFERVYIDHGNALAWSEDIEICAESLYLKITGVTLPFTKSLESNKFYE